LSRNKTNEIVTVYLRNIGRFNYIDKTQINDFGGLETSGGYNWW